MPVIGMIRFSARGANFFLWGWILNQVQNGIYRAERLFLSKQTNDNLLKVSQDGECLLSEVK